MSTLLQKLRALDDGASRPVTILEREVCGQVAHEIEQLLIAFKPLAAYMAGPGFSLLPPDAKLTQGSSFARQQLTAGDLRALAEALAKFKPEGA